MRLIDLIFIIQIDVNSGIVTTSQLIDHCQAATIKPGKSVDSNYCLLKVSPLVANQTILQDLLPSSQKQRALTRLRSIETFVITHFLLRHILGDLFNQPSQFYDNEFLLTPLGKPHVMGIEFNISYRNTIGGVLVSKHPCGIDVEENRHVNYLGIAHNFFSHREQSHLSQSKNLGLDFYKIWTQKEAIIKASGQGLAQMSSICTFQKDYQLDEKSSNICYETDTLFQNNEFTVAYCKSTSII